MGKLPAHTSRFVPATSSQLTATDIARFRETVYAHARTSVRNFPWRETTDPYRIMVSEVMLQQTQVERVRTKFIEFIDRFPDVSALAEADLSEVLTLWQGLGYNRRALALKKAAEAIMADFAGVVPDDPKLLETLPGIGHYTAGAIVVFAFDRPAVFIETNIRSVYIHHFHKDRADVHDRELLPLIAASMDQATPRRWYNALMDYGAALKRAMPNPSRKSAHHSQQPPFIGSNRQLRSAILRIVLATPGITADEISRNLAAEPSHVERNLADMAREGLITSITGRYRIA
jgi:A/G-specific adenine glycosylase